MVFALLWNSNSLTNLTPQPLHKPPTCLSELLPQLLDQPSKLQHAGDTTMQMDPLRCLLHFALCSRSTHKTSFFDTACPSSFLTKTDDKIFKSALPTMACAPDPAIWGPRQQEQPAGHDLPQAKQLLGKFHSSKTEVMCHADSFHLEKIKSVIQLVHLGWSKMDKARFVCQ